MTYRGHRTIVCVYQNCGIFMVSYIPYLNNTVWTTRCKPVRNKRVKLGDIYVSFMCIFYFPYLVYKWSQYLFSYLATTTLSECPYVDNTELAIYRTSRDQRRVSHVRIPRSIFNLVIRYLDNLIRNEVVYDTFSEARIVELSISHKYNLPPWTARNVIGSKVLSWGLGENWRWCIRDLARCIPGGGIETLFFLSELINCVYRKHTRSCSPITHSLTCDKPLPFWPSTS